MRAFKLHSYSSEEYDADVVKKFIFRYLSVPLTNGYRNILVVITNKDIFNNPSS
jgi:hypothetical protein